MTEIPHVVKFGNITPDLHPVVGGKCASLGVMMQAGLPVPPGFAVTTSAYAAARANSTDYGELTEVIATTGTEDPVALQASARKAREIVRQWSFPPEIEASVREMYAELEDFCGIPNLPVAVRSSATSEDNPDASFAGEHDTHLWVRGADDVIDKIKACWASMFTDRAISYREEMGYDHATVEMAVAVQKMVHPRAAGVAFTLDPTNGDRSSICIDSAWGFGEGVVSGEVTPDNFLVDKVMWHIGRRTISPKTHAYQLDQDRVRRVELDPDISAAPSLTDAEIVAVAKLARQAEKHYGRPQDIEWALDQELPDGENVVLLQARPETVWSKKSTHVGANTDAISSIVNTLMNPLHTKRSED